jgi:hypothetical protein
MSRTRSSSTSPSSTTTILRPWARRAASRCSTPKRARRSRCSATMVMAVGSESSFASFLRRPFIPDPTSVTTSETARPWAVAHPTRRATWRSRSDLWSCEETRA